MTTKENQPRPFWETKSLEELTQPEWESLCDGCGQCCLVKLEDEDTGEIFITNIACRMLDMETCRCKDYQHRSQVVPTCLVLGPNQIQLFGYLPETCAYRCLFEGRELPGWHPLLSGDGESVIQAGISIKPYAMSEEFIHPEQFSEHVIGKLPDDEPGA